MERHTGTSMVKPLTSDALQAFVICAPRQHLMQTTWNLFGCWDALVPSIPFTRSCIPLAGTHMFHASYRATILEKQLPGLKVNLHHSTLLPLTNIHHLHYLHYSIALFAQRAKEIWNTWATFSMEPVLAWWRRKHLMMVTADECRGALIAGFCLWLAWAWLLVHISWVAGPGSHHKVHI